MLIFFNEEKKLLFFILKTNTFQIFTKIDFVYSYLFLNS